MNKLGSTSNKNIIGIDARLAIVIGAVLAEGNVDFTITYGLRTVEEQQNLYAQGRTKEGNIVTNCDGVKNISYHQTGKAIDFTPYPFDGDWKNLKQFEKIGREFIRVSELLGYECSYGGDWKSFKDWPHFQLGKV